MAAADGGLTGISSWRGRFFGGRALWSAVDAAASPVSALLLAAGLVRTLGASDYGLIVMALAVSALSTSVSPAIAATTTRFVSEISTGSQMKSEVSRILTGSLLVVAAMNVLLLSVAVLFAGPLSAAVFGSVIASRPDIIPIMLLAVAALSLQQIDGVLAAALKGLQMFRPQATTEVICRLCLVLLVVSAAYVSGNVESTLSVYCASFGIFCLVRFQVVKKKLGLNSLLSLPDARDLKRLVSFSGWMWFNVIATMAYGSVDRVIVGRASGTTAMAEFNVYMQLTQLVHFVPASIFAFAYPVFGKLGANIDSRLGEVKFLFARFFVRCVVVGLAVAAALVLFMHPLIRIVSAGVFTMSHEFVFMLLIVNFMLLAVSVIPYYAALGLGDARSVSLITSLSMLVSLGMTVVLTPRLGLEGAVYARLAYSVGVLYLFVLLRRIFNPAIQAASVAASDP